MWTDKYRAMGKFTAYISAVVIMLAIVVPHASVAQDSTATEATPPTAPDNQQTAGIPPSESSKPAQTQSEPPAGKQPSSASDDVFTPTEEISEDLSVSFPVDI